MTTCLCFIKSMLNGLRLNPVLIKLAPQAGFEPATYRLTAGRSAVELLRSIWCISIILKGPWSVKSERTLTFYFPSRRAIFCKISSYFSCVIG